MSDPYMLSRFVVAQAPLMEQVRAELRAGRKQSHFMWFVFPQLAGLGHSAMARRYAITSLAEAEAYLQHPLLGARLRECAELLLGHAGRPIAQIMGSPDDVKLRSSMTLFARATPDNHTFLEVLRLFYGGVPDPATLERL